MTVIVIRVWEKARVKKYFSARLKLVTNIQLIRFHLNTIPITHKQNSMTHLTRLSLPVLNRVFVAILLSD